VGSGAHVPMIPRPIIVKRPPLTDSRHLPPVTRGRRLVGVGLAWCNPHSWVRYRTGGKPGWTQVLPLVILFFQACAVTINPG